jgi:preprotein translocase subunit SecA
VLVGVPTEMKATVVSRRLEVLGLPHQRLTSKDDAREATLIARAGAPGAITVATQVAGRGTDILLGGPEREDAEAVRALGGLRVLGLDRHRSRRVDDQLRGRAGRGGDPGSTCFFLSPEDELFRRDAEPAVQRAAAALDVSRDAARLRAHADAAQEHAERVDAGHRATQRKLDAVYEEQRVALGRLRARLLEGRPDLESAEDVDVASMRDAIRTPVTRLVAAHERSHGGALRPRLLARDVYRLFGCLVTLAPETTTLEEAREQLIVDVARSTVARLRELRALAHAAAPELGRPPEEITRALELRARRDLPRRVLRFFRAAYLDELDHGFRTHLETMNALRDALPLFGAAPGDPILHYKKSAAEAFERMIREAQVRAITRVLEAPTLARAHVEALEQPGRSPRASARPGEHDDDGEAVRGAPGPGPLRHPDADEAGGPVEGGLELPDLADGASEGHEAADPTERE